MDLMATPLSLPEAFISILNEVVRSDKLPETLETFCRKKPTSFRLNPLKGDPAIIRRELEEAGFVLTPVDWYPLAFMIDDSQRRSLTESASFLEGRVYIQSLSSMLAPLVLEPKPGEVVLDLAAAPGGKTLMIAAIMKNRGRLSAVEAVRGRFFKLRANLDLHGATMVKTYLMDGRDVGRKCPGMFDRVLLDAPCSSEARFTCLDPNSWAHWSPRKVEEAARKQKGLIRSAAESLKDGGALVYCTCSYSPEENELVVEDLLKRSKGRFRIVPISVPIENVQPGITRWKGKELHPELAHAVRILPNTFMDGFFLCKLQATHS